MLIAWANTGATKGDPKDLPPAPVYPEGWAMGKPDVVFEMEEEYSSGRRGHRVQYFYIPTNFTEPKWIQAIELRPGNREVVHHALAFYRAKPDMHRTPVLSPNREQMVLPPPPKRARGRTRGSDPEPLLATYRRAPIPRSSGPEPPSGSSQAG